MHDERRHGSTQVDRDGVTWRVLGAGPGAAYLEADAPPSAALTRQLAARRAALWRDRPRSVHDLIPAFRGLLAEFRAGADRDEVERWLRGSVPVRRPAVAAADDATASGATAGDGGARHHVVRVAYGLHADREALERASGLAFDELVRLHAEATYTTAFIGFTPGFPYLHGLPPALSLPRRARPAARIPAGAVAIADRQAGIYPSASPGGWWVLGITDARLFDARRWPPTLLAGGDTLRFTPVPAESLLPYEPDGAALELEADDAVVRIEAVWPSAATLQAAPRRGVGHHGMAQAGALDAAAFEAALEIAGAPRRSAALELLVPQLTLTVLRTTTVAVTGSGATVHLDGRPAATWRPLHAAAGTRIRLEASGGGTSYLTIGGGFRWPWPDAVHPALLSVSSSDVRAGLGRPLRAGDALAAANPAISPRAWAGRPRYGTRAYLRIHAGPQVSAAAIDALTTVRWRVAARDRTGARLEGPAVTLERHDVTSQGVPLGAIQLPADGQPVVLLADRGRTGGYAVPAVVDPRDLWQLAHARPGSEVWFVPPDRRR